MEDIAWKPIPGYPGYEASDQGSLRCGTQILNLREVAGYQRTGLVQSGVKRTVLVHRMVALAFLPSPADGQTQVNHKNGVKCDNSISNLEWCTPAENQRHAAETGLRNRKAKPGRAVERRSVSTGEVTVSLSVRAAAREVGLRSHKCILTAIIHPERTSAGFYWRYPSIEPISPEETWKRIEDCDGFALTKVAYSVSSEGRVKNFEYDRLLTPTLTAAGYLVVGLTIPRGHRCFFVHRLVATAFCDPPDISPSLDVDHVNRDKTDNRAVNLQWLARAEHQRKTRGVAVVQIGANGERVETYSTVSDAAKTVGVNPQSITDALHGRAQQSAGFKWVRKADLDAKEMEEYLDSLLDLF